MFLFEYIVKLLLGNTNTLFLGLVIVLFGYYGWLLYNINNRLHTFTYEWDKFNDKLKEILHKLEKFDELYYQELAERLNDNKNILKEINTCLNAKNLDLEKIEEKIIAEVKEESGEIKERMKILVGRTRSNSVQSRGSDFEKKNNM